MKRIIPNMKRRKLFLSWLISYFIILLIAALISVVVYGRVVKTIENETVRGNSLFLSKLQQSADSRLKDIQQLSVMIALETRVGSIASVKDEFSPYNQEDISRVVNLLDTIKSANRFVDEIYIYLKNKDTVLDTVNHTSSSIAFQLLHSGSHTTYDEWLRLLNKNYKGEIIPYIDCKRGSDYFNSIAHIQSIPMGVLNNSQATLVILFDKTKFEEIIKNVDWTDKHTLAILDQSNHIIVSTGPFQAADIQNCAKEISGDNLLYDTINGQKVVVTYLTSDVSDFKYMVVMPYGVFWEKVSYARNLMFLGIVIFVLIGAVAAYFIVRRNYKPINNIIGSIAEKVGLSIDNENNELGYIQKALHMTMEENDKIVKKMQEQNDALRSNFLLKLLKGRTEESASMKESFSNFNIHFKTDCFAVILFLIEDYRNLFKDEQMAKSEDELMLVQFIITNVVEELIGLEHQGFMTEVDSSVLACIINFGETTADDTGRKQQMYEIACRAQQFIQERLQVYFSVAIGNIHKTVTGISYSYREALDAMEYRVMMGDSKIFRVDDMNNSSSYYDYSTETEYKLINNIREGNFESSQAILNTIFDRNFVDLSLSIEAGKCLVFDLLSSIIKIVDDNKYLEVLQPINRLKNCDTILKMKNEIVYILEQVCAYFREKNIQKSDSRLSADVIQFIENNYFDMNLNVNRIGEQFDITPGYLSRLFKQKVGEGLHDYIDRIRLENAKRLMMKGDFNINDIAGQVGYTNSKTFIRIFKKYEGVTPGKYKIVR